MHFVLVHAYWDLDPLLAFCIGACILGFRSITCIVSLDFIHSLCAVMPPKLRKQGETRGEETVGEELESEYSASSPVSVASTASVAPGMLMSAEQLQLVLEANNRSMVALLGRLPPPVVAEPSPSVVPPKIVRIDVPKWKDEDTPFDFFSKFEKAQKHNGVSRDQWGTLLEVYLSGKAQAAYAQVDPEKLEDYEAVKNTMLRSLGDTPEQADRNWWKLGRKAGETIGSFYLRMRSTATRRFHGVVTRDDMFEKVLLSRFMSLLSADCYNCISARYPKTGEEAAEMVNDYENRGDFSKRYLAGGNNGGCHQQQSYYSKREGGSGSGSVHGSSNSTKGSAGNNSGSSGNSSGSGSSPSQAQGTGNSQAGGGKGGQQDKQRERKPIICFGCGEAGHIRPNCPNKVRRVKPEKKGSVVKPEKKESVVKTVDGYLAGKEVKGLRLDTGADRTLVRRELIPGDAYTGETVVLDTWRGQQPSTHKVARITIRVGSVEVIGDVAVADTLDYPALLGTDLGEPIQIEIMEMVVLKLKDSLAQKVTEQSEKVEVIRITRAQVTREQNREEADELASALSESTPVPLSDILVFPDAYFEEDPVPTPVAELSTWPVEEVVDFPIPKLVKDDSDRGRLVAEQQSDQSLVQVLNLAKKGEKGYGFEEGVLVHSTCDSLGDSNLRMVVPKGRRQQVLELAHSNLAAGHFGIKKTFGRISRHFLWPRMWVEVKNFVRTCAGCQRAARNDNSRAPLQPLPCVSEPFEKVAFDLVDPLPKTSGGHRYLLTMMCLYTKYPEAIPLRRVDQETVLEAMLEVFSRHGLPKTILTDQGSVFMSKLTTKLWETLGVHRVRTSPYHPQSDGALERWRMHA